jgi:hypothetical protein
MYHIISARILKTEDYKIVPSKRYGNEMALSFYPKLSVEDEKWNNHFFIYERADANANTLILSLI